jgi:hypothetical protein
MAESQMQFQGAECRTGRTGLTSRTGMALRTCRFYRVAFGGGAAQDAFSGVFVPRFPGNYTVFPGFYLRRKRILGEALASGSAVGMAGPPGRDADRGFSFRRLTLRSATGTAQLRKLSRAGAPSLPCLVCLTAGGRGRMACHSPNQFN